MKEITERAQRVAAEIFPRDDEQAKAAAMLIGREMQEVAKVTLRSPMAACAYCDEIVNVTPEAMQAHIDSCEQHPSRQLKLERGRLEILMAALSELKQEFDLVPKRNHWALMRIRIAFRDVDELKL